jgi:MYXO-CTERM domain-containing protein
LTTACRYPSAQIGCRAASCSNDVATISASCDGAGSCPTLETQSCGPYHCAATICAGNCGKDSDCGAGYFCPAGICRPTGALGVKCAAARDCASGHCADGVCCDSECAGQCEACNQFGQGGACKPVVGVPLGVRATCIGSGTCAATCDGVHPNECTPPDAHTLCRAASCGFGVATAAAYCNGSGSCPEVSTLSCEPYACAGSDCADLCKGNGDCAAGYTCSEGACVKEADTGASCTADAKCTSGHCVDGVCCESACVSQCSACDVAGSLGHCVAVEGAAHGARAQCAAGSQCQGGICATVSGGTSGCGCSSSAGAMPAFGLLMLFSLAVGRRRRWR